MKQAFTLFCFAAVSSVVSAQSLLIYTDGSKVPQTISISSIDSIVVQQPNGHPDMTELVEMQIKNVGRYSFDVDIKKGDNCSRYVVGAMYSHVYNENSFVELAQQSLDTNSFYRPFAESIGSSDMTYAERQLGINSILNYDPDTKEAVYTTIAVYAERADGGYKVYKQDIIVPDAIMGSTPTATIVAENVTSDNFTVNVTASSDCKKIIIGVTSPQALNGTKMSAEAMLSKKVSQGLPSRFSGQITFNANERELLSPNSVYYPYVIPIAEDGSVGQVCYISVQTQPITSDGIGKILSATGTLQIEGQYRTVSCPKMTFNDNVRKVRIMWCNETDFKTNYTGHLTEVFGKESQRDRAWSEFDVDNIPRAFVVNHYGDPYYMYAVTLDSNSGISEAQDVLALLGESSPYITHGVCSFAPDITFDGVATVDIKNDDIEKRYGQYEYNKDMLIEANPYFTINNANNLDRVLVMRIEMDGDVEQGVESILAGFPNYYVGYGGVSCELLWQDGEWKPIPADALGLDSTNEGGLVRFKEKWLSGERLVFVTIDTNGRPKIHSFFTPAPDGGVFTICQ